MLAKRKKTTSCIQIKNHVIVNIRQSQIEVADLRQEVYNANNRKRKPFLCSQVETWQRLFATGYTKAVFCFMNTTNSLSRTPVSDLLWSFFVALYRAALRPTNWLA